MNKFLAYDDETPPTYEMVRHNCELALRLWRERVDPKRVNLAVWKGYNSHKCGSVACFGGWLGTWPEYLALPGAVAKQGMPVIVAKNQEHYDVDAALFGASMFNVACESADGDNYRDYTDYDLVVRRLERRLREVS